jgi:hypothetical protein
VKTADVSALPPPRAERIIDVRPSALGGRIEISTSSKPGVERRVGIPSSRGVFGEHIMVPPARHIHLRKSAIFMRSLYLRSGVHHVDSLGSSARRGRVPWTAHDIGVDAAGLGAARSRNPSLLCRLFRA